MTPDQIAELDALNAAVAVAPSELAPTMNRAHFLALHEPNFGRVAASWRGFLEWRYASALIAQARAGWRVHQRARRGTSSGAQMTAQKRVAGASTVAIFGLLIAWSRPLSRWLDAQSQVPTFLLTLEIALSSSESPRDWHAPLFDFLVLPTPTPTIEELELWALATAIVQNDIAAATLYARVLRAQIGAGTPIPNRARCLRGARDNRWASYQQLAHLHMAVEAAPDDIALRLHRARWLTSKRRFVDVARADLNAAIRLCPERADLYEKRADLGLGESLWEARENQPMPHQDYATALRLRVESGAVSGNASRLKTRGDRWMTAMGTTGLSIAAHCGRAHACYSLALQSRPDDARLYLARAHALCAVRYKSYAPHFDHRSRAHHDITRALVLQPWRVRARRALTEFLSQTLVRESNHEQIEALLNARRELEQAGISAQLANAILAEVERALAE